MNDEINRRRFLEAGIGLAAFSAAANFPSSATATDDRQDAGPKGRLASIERQVLFSGRPDGVTWFHPRTCVVPTPNASPLVLMTLQTISGSDVYGPVHWTTSRDLGRTWTKPEPISGLGRKPLDGEWEVGVCDVSPDYHPPTNTVLAVGHNVYYRGNVLAKPQRSRWPVYTSWSPGAGWSEPRRLEWDDPRNTAIYTCGCAQRVALPDGDILIPLSFGPVGREDRSVATVRCGFDGRELRIRAVGTELRLPVKRGLLEPSMVRLGDRFFLTIRAEDGRGYVSASDDGLAWTPQRPWCWQDGEPLAMSSTQQHWLTHADELYLVYTRKTAENARVVRWRAPLYMARVDPKTLRLIASTEQIVLPLVGDAADDPKHVALMGNFHPLAVTQNEAWVTVGEERSNDGWHGDTLLARIRWSVAGEHDRPER